jgi:hypothetical protein
LDAVNSIAMVNDSKTFVDMPLKKTESKLDSIVQMLSAWIHRFHAYPHGFHGDSADPRFPPDPWIPQRFRMEFESIRRIPSMWNPMNCQNSTWISWGAIGIRKEFSIGFLKNFEIFEVYQTFQIYIAQN